MSHFLSIPRRPHTGLLRYYKVDEQGCFGRHWLCHRTLSNFKYISDWGSLRRFVKHALRMPPHSDLTSPKPADFLEELAGYCRWLVRTSDIDPQTAAGGWCLGYFWSGLAPAAGDTRAAPGSCSLYQNWSAWTKARYLSARICDGRPSSGPCSATGGCLGFQRQVASY